MSAVATEITSQPDLWERAAALAPEVADQLPEPGARLAVIGCGTSLFMAQAFAALREQAGQGETDAFPASEFPARRPYDAVLAISRSGTTTEVVRALEELGPETSRVAISTAAGLPVVEAAQRSVLLPFADEDSVVQTRFATTTFALLRAHLGDDLEALIAEGAQALARELPADPEQFEHFVFLGTGPSVGLASEAALKFREAAQAWSEAYPAKEYRHGPISVAGSRTLVWLLGVDQPDLVADIAATGATVVDGRGDPLAELVLTQRAAVRLAAARGLDPDRPTHLSRSVVLP